MVFWKVGYPNIFFRNKCVPLVVSGGKQTISGGKQTIHKISAAFIVKNCHPRTSLRAFIGVETAALTFRTKQYSTSYSSHICYGKRFYNDFFLNHNTITLVHNCLKLLSCVVIETALNGMKENYLDSLLSTRKRTI